MISPAVYLAIGIFTEVAVQASKRLVFFGEGNGFGYEFILGIGDAIFALLFLGLLKVISFNRQQITALVICVIVIGYSIIENGAFATVLAFRNTYLWFLVSILFLLEHKPMDEQHIGRALFGVIGLFSLIIIAYSFIQIQTDYAFERPWFDLSGSSLKYEGVTNFGTASKAFSFLGGPTDLACFGLFVLAVGLGGRNVALFSLGTVILLLSGVRGVIFAIPLWYLFAHYLPSRIRPAIILLMITMLTLVWVYASELINIFYAIQNSRFSLATLAPRIKMWTSIEFENVLMGEGLAANMSADIVGGEDEMLLAFDSEFVYLVVRVGLPLAFIFLYVTLGAAQRANLKYRLGAFSVMAGVFSLASIVQLPFHTRFPNFLLCVIAYAGICYSKKETELPPAKAGGFNPND